MRYIPVHTNIVVRLIEEEKEGIVSAVESPIIKGYVEEIGSGRYADGKITPMLVRPSSFVWFHRNSATQLPESIAKNLFVLNQDDILVIEEDGDVH